MAVGRNTFQCGMSGPYLASRWLGKDHTRLLSAFVYTILQLTPQASDASSIQAAVFPMELVAVSNTHVCMGEACD